MYATFFVGGKSHGYSRNGNPVSATHCRIRHTDLLGGEVEQHNSLGIRPGRVLHVDVLGDKLYPGSNFLVRTNIFADGGSDTPWGSPMPPYRNCSFYQIQFLTTFEGSCTCFVQVPSIFYIIGNIILKQHSLTTWYFNILNKYVYNKIYYKISIDSENHCVIIIMYLNKVKLKRYEGVQKCKSLKPLGLYTQGILQK